MDIMASNPSFRIIGAMPCDQELEAEDITFTDGLLVVLQEFFVVVWNVLQDTWIKWEFETDTEQYLVRSV